MDPYAIDIEACRGRQQRLLELMHELELDLVIVTQREHVQWLAGPCYPFTFQPRRRAERPGPAHTRGAQ